MNFVPIVTAIGSLFVVMWGDPNPRNASRGAMDNATGIGLSYAVIKYFKEHPEKMPKNCRIVDANIGSEEAGLRGSMHFAQEHRFDDLSQNAWNINIDSVADKEYFYHCCITSHFLVFLGFSGFVSPCTFLFSGITWFIFA